jgi:hypothetical protein
MVTTFGDRLHGARSANSARTKDGSTVPVAAPNGGSARVYEVL